MDTARQLERPVVLLVMADEALRHCLARWLRHDADVHALPNPLEWLRNREASALLFDEDGAVEWTELLRFTPAAGRCHAVVDDPRGKRGTALHQRGARVWRRADAREMVRRLSREWRLFTHDDGPRAWETLRVANEVSLTARQAEVLLLACMELTPAEAAERLGISEETIKKHFQAIRHKAGIPLGTLCRRLRTYALQARGSAMA